MNGDVRHESDNISEIYVSVGVDYGC